MQRRNSDEDWEDAAEDLDDEEFEDDDLDDSEETIPCPYCEQPVYEDAEWCPHCDQYISDEDARTSAKPLWIVLGVVLCLLVVFAWILMN